MLCGKTQMYSVLKLIYHRGLRGLTRNFLKRSASNSNSLWLMLGKCILQASCRFKCVTVFVRIYPLACSSATFHYVSGRSCFCNAFKWIPRACLDGTNRYELLHLMYSSLIYILRALLLGWLEMKLCKSFVFKTVRNTIWICKSLQSEPYIQEIKCRILNVLNLFFLFVVSDVLCIWFSLLFYRDSKSIIALYVFVDLCILKIEASETESF